MALIQEVRGKRPQIGKNCWLAANATLVGDVILGDNCSVWFNAVIRGDVGKIHIGSSCNIQDGAILHCTFGHSDVWMGEGVSIGHGAIVHGCRIEKNSLIGMNAVVLDNAVIEEEVLVAAGSVVLENSNLSKGHLYAGAPARLIKPIDRSLRETLLKTPSNYIGYARWFKDSSPETI